MSIRKAWHKKGRQLLDEIRDTKVSEDELAIWYLGQCGFVVKQRKIIYIDPVLNDMQDEHGNSRRFYEPPFEPEMAEADYVFCTHEHADHMAKETVLGIYKIIKQSDLFFQASVRKPPQAGEYLRTALLKPRRISRWNYQI